MLAPASWRLNNSKLGSSGAFVGAGLQLSIAGTKSVGSGSAHGNAAAWTTAGARKVYKEYVNIIMSPCVQGVASSWED